MIAELASLFALSLLISLSTFGGGSQALFYQYGVVQQQWISSVDLSAYLAFGYATPGPAVFGTAVFIGYHLGGVPGALVGTVGIFLMPFALAIAASKYLSHLLTSPPAEMFIKGVGLAAAGLVAATALNVGQLSSLNLWQAVVFVSALAASTRWKISPLYILLVGGTVGLVL